MDCEDSCNQLFHHSYFGFNKSEFQILEKSKNIFYLCDTRRLSCKIENKSENDKKEDTLPRLPVVAVSNRIHELSYDLLNKLRGELNNLK